MLWWCNRSPAAHSHRHRRRNASNCLGSRLLRFHLMGVKERRNYQNQSQNFKEKFLGFGSGKEKLLISEENRENQILEKSDASVSFFSWGTIKQGDIMKSKGRIKLKRDQVHKGYFWGLGLKIDSHLCSGFYLAELKHLNLDENSQCVLLKVSLKKKHF